MVLVVEMMADLGVKLCKSKCFFGLDDMTEFIIIRLKYYRTDHLNDIEFINLV